MSRFFNLKESFLHVPTRFTVICSFRLQVNRSSVGFFPMMKIQDKAWVVQVADAVQLKFSSSHECLELSGAKRSLPEDWSTHMAILPGSKQHIPLSVIHIAFAGRL